MNFDVDSYMQWLVRLSWGRLSSLNAFPHPLQAAPKWYIYHLLYSKPALATLVY